MSVQVWSLDDVEVARIEEMVGPMFDPVSFFPDFDPALFAAHADWLEPAHVAPGGRIVSSMHSWLLRLPRAGGGSFHVLVDGCIGDHKDRMPYHRWTDLDSGWPRRLAAAGVTPEEIDVVLCTHLHVDHVGWNTRREGDRWVPTFPNARYLFSRAEIDAFRARRAEAKASDFEAVGDKVWDDSVLPILDAGLADIVDGTHAVHGERLRMEPTPGHTPGSISLCLADAADGRDRALFTGDVFHHPVQVVRPDWNSAFCELPEQARTTRRQLLERLADTDALLMTAHFATPFAARVRRTAEAYGLDFVAPDRVIALPD
ncbi:MAG TPA: MBL fold metallo-hydrolase [Pseudomonadales bacterium]|nr:MBL fold metallo-hydrolase [Pseudomonadales bacterium]